MVAVVPAHRGKGLGCAVTLAVRHKLRDEGLCAAELLTDDHRLAAIKTYLDVGFEPSLTHENHPGTLGGGLRGARPGVPLLGVARGLPIRKT